MHLIAYVSTARKLFSSSDLADLLIRSRKANAEFGITGLLLYKGGNFVQVIEGPEQAVKRLYININADGAHYNVMTVLNESVSKRAFPDWSMGFLKQGDVEDIPGFTNFLKDQIMIEEFKASSHEAKQMLSNFGTMMR